MQLVNFHEILKLVFREGATSLSNSEVNSVLNFSDCTSISGKRNYPKFKFIMSTSGKRKKPQSALVCQDQVTE
jgi:hypothetical protein